MSQNRAVLVGIDHYSPPNELFGCAKDAKDLSEVLSRHDDNERNFHCELITSVRDRNINAAKLKKEIDDLFSKAATCVLFYYAGHAIFDVASSNGYFVLPSENGYVEKLPFDYLLDHANRALSKGIPSTVIILDCCGAGAFGETYQLDDTSQTAKIGNGVTILAASGRLQEATEQAGTGGMFTQYVVEGLRGSAADLQGRVSAASVYSHVDHMLGPKGQRPVYKANVDSFVRLRKCKERIPFETLMALPELFKNPNVDFQLNPTFEPKRDNTPPELDNIPPDPLNVAKFEMLQQLNRQGLVVPVDAEHMYYAAIESKSCRLTELGKHYRELAELDLL